MEKLTQIFTIVKYQKTVLTVFVRRFLQYITDNIEVTSDSDKEDCDEENYNEEKF